MKPEMFFRKARLKERLEEECHSYIDPIWSRYQKEVLNQNWSRNCANFEIYRDYISIEYVPYDYSEYKNVPIEFFIDFDKALEDHRKKVEEKALTKLKKK